MVSVDKNRKISGHERSEIKKQISLIEAMNQKAQALIEGTKCDEDGAPIFNSSVDSPEDDKPLIVIDSES
jgi:hypothetical protein